MPVANDRGVRAFTPSPTESATTTTTSTSTSTITSTGSSISTTSTNTQPKVALPTTLVTQSPPSTNPSPEVDLDLTASSLPSEISAPGKEEAWIKLPLSAFTKIRAQAKEAGSLKIAKEKAETRALEIKVKKEKYKECSKRFERERDDLRRFLSTASASGVRRGNGGDMALEVAVLKGQLADRDRQLEAAKVREESQEKELRELRDARRSAAELKRRCDELEAARWAKWEDKANTNKNTNMVSRDPRLVKSSKGPR